MQQCDVLIIGAGLTGMTLAYYLRDSGLKVDILEARDRLGGRIETIGYFESQPIEMGATWLGREHHHLLALLKALDIEIFEQVIGSRVIYEAISTSPHYLASIPPNDAPPLRVKGGSYKIIDKLHSYINDEKIFLSQRVVSITESAEGLKIKTNDMSFVARKVVSTLPPNLLVNTINFEPNLSSALIGLAKKTHTWMGESIKIAINYAAPFWRNENSSGTIFSNVGPVPEMYDHGNEADSHFTLMGFLNGSYSTATKDERLEIILRQLRKYYGKVVDDYKSYHEKVWRHESETFHGYESNITPHLNQGHDMYQKVYMNNKLILAGAETSPLMPGYMDGAIYSALRAVKNIK